MPQYTHHALRIQNILSIKRKKLKSVKMLEYGKILQKKDLLMKLEGLYKRQGTGNGFDDRTSSACHDPGRALSLSIR